MRTRKTGQMIVAAATCVSLFCVDTHARTDAFADPGHAAYDGGRYDAAERIFAEALRAAEAARDRVAIAVASNNLGMTHLKQGRLRDAVRLLQTAERTWQSVAPLSVDLAVCLENLALPRDLRGRRDEVVALLGRALAMKTLVLGPRHPELLVPNLHLASVHQREGNLAEAERLYGEAVPARSGTPRRPLHPELPVVLNNLAALHRERGERSDAERRLRQALALANERVPPDAAQVAGILDSLANLAGDRGRAMRPASSGGAPRRRGIRRK